MAGTFADMKTDLVSRVVNSHPSTGTFIANAIDGSVEMPLDAAHLSNIERAQEFNSAVLAFLS